MYKILIVIIFIISLFIKVSSNFTLNYKDIELTKYEKENFNFIYGQYPFYGNLKLINNEINRLYTLSDYIYNNKYDDKISIKLSFFKNNGILSLITLYNFINYCNNRSIFIFIDSMLIKDRDYELDTYLKCNDLFDNIGLTIACYHHNVDKYVDTILNNNGHIRLVKGWYNDNTINKWNIVSNNYIRNSEKLIKSNKYHVLATHDFKILNYLYNKYNKIDNIEIAFFYFYKNYVFEKLKEFPYEIKNKCFYIPLGRRYLSLFHTFRFLSIKREIQRRLNLKIK